jgi:hypothetical protein
MEVLVYFFVANFEPMKVTNMRMRMKNNILMETNVVINVASVRVRVRMMNYIRMTITTITMLMMNNLMTMMVMVMLIFVRFEYIIGFVPYSYLLETRVSAFFGVLNVSNRLSVKKKCSIVRRKHLIVRRKHLIVRRKHLIVRRTETFYIMQYNFITLYIKLHYLQL